MGKMGCFLDQLLEYFFKVLEFGLFVAKVEIEKVSDSKEAKKFQLLSSATFVSLLLSCVKFRSKAAAFQN